MDKITIVEGEDLRHLCALLGVSADKRPYRIRIHQSADASGVKVKVNEGTWTPWLGTKDI